LGEVPLAVEFEYVEWIEREDDELPLPLSSSTESSLLIGTMGEELVKFWKRPIPWAYT
jgi:hypothetical protein